MTVIGAGVIGLELGSVWSRLGSKVTVIEYLGALGSGMDLGMAKAFQRILEQQGMSFKFEHKVTSAKSGPNGVTCTIEPAKGGSPTQHETDVLLVSVGRRPYTADLGLKENGIKMDERGRIDIGAHFKTSKPNVYAIGDCVKGAMLAHKAEEEGIACVEYIVKGGGHVNYDAIPSVIYTHPEVAWVGKSEEQLKAEGVQYNIGNFPFIANSRAKTIGQTAGFVKVLADKTTDTLLGVHIVNTIAGDMIAEAALALEYGASAEDVARTSHAHPGVGEALKEACMAACGMKAIHM
jgi:dihydrolipoamide dehydrogenase